MDYFFYNTDKSDESLKDGESRIHVLIQNGLAVTSGPRAFGEQLGRLSTGDILLMYENQLGVVAVGTVLEEWDGESHSPPVYYLGRFGHEYRIKVNWFCDRSDNPVSLAELRRRVGSPRYTPRGAISQKIVKWRTEIETMIEELCDEVRSKRASTSLATNPATITITQFFADVLGAKLKNHVWSWGASDPTTNRVFLRVWQDNIETRRDGERVLVALDKPRRDSHGFAERHDHLAQMQNGADGFGIVCTAVDIDTTEVRKIASFEKSTLLRLGALIKEKDGIYARIEARVPTEEVIYARNSHSTVVEDLKEIEKRNIPSTTKDTLVSARIGQGTFREQVLQLWGNRCSVTGSTTRAAIRASHIKPWSESDDGERLDPNNGLALIASLDALFDAGLISFDTSGDILVSPNLNAIERQIFSVDEVSLTKRPSAATGKYLAYHRKKYRFEK